MEATKAVKLETLVQELNQMVLNGKILEAFEKFYAPEITLQENEDEPVVGKDAGRTKEEGFVNGITEFRHAAVKNVIVSDNITVVEWDFDFTHKDWGVRNYTQVSVQRWNDAGQIVNEKFYYNR